MLAMRLKKKTEAKELRNLSPSRTIPWDPCAMVNGNKNNQVTRTLRKWEPQE